MVKIRHCPFWWPTPEIVQKRTFVVCLLTKVGKCDSWHLYVKNQTKSLDSNCQLPQPTCSWKWHPDTCQLGNPTRGVCPASGWWCYLTRAGEDQSANRICIYCTSVSVFFASRWWCWLVSRRCLWRSHLICRQFCINSDYLCIYSQHNVDCDATVSVCPARGWWRWWKSCRVYWRSLLICK